VRRLVVDRRTPAFDLRDLGHDDPQAEIARRSAK
jgi:hypothetical protein